MAKNKKHRFWFFIGVVAVLLAGPNNIAIRHTLDYVDPVMFNVLRFGVIAFLITPYIIFKWKTYSRKAWRYSLIVGAAMSVAVTTHVWAIQESQASYVAILSLFSPIIFIFYAMRFNKEKLNRRSFAGITLAAAGAFAIVALPVILHKGSEFIFYPFATFLLVFRLFSFPLAIIFAKKAHDAKMPILVTMGISSWVVFLTSSLTAFFGPGWVLPDMQNPEMLIGVLYSAVMVSLLARMGNVLSYEKIGSVASSALAYGEVLLAVILPVFILHEKLSAEMIFGGVLILLGVYTVEHHRMSHHKHENVLKDH